MTTQNAGHVWQAALGQLQLQVTRPSYQTWLKDTVGLDHSDGEFVVGAPNAFVAEMLDQRMYTLISQTLSGMVDSSVDVRFQVIPDSPAANGNHAPEPPPVPPARASVRSSAANDGAQMNPKYVFERFIVGKSNELAHAAALAVSERPGLAYNPLFLYSGVGLGKTHLLHAIGHRIMAKGLSVINATTEQFTNEYIKSIREGKTEEFRSTYRSADVLLLDDIQFIIGKEQTQEGFFHTFNALHMASRQIVITSDRPATALTLLEDRISSRLAGGLVVDIQPPDIETRLAILNDKASASGQSFPVDVLQYLSERVHSNIRELEGCLNRLAAYADMASSAINLDMVKRVISDILRPQNSRRISDVEVLDAVSAYFSVDKETLLGRRRDKRTALARQIAMYLMREETGLPLAAIGRFLGGKDHTTVLHACQKISTQFDLDVHLRRDILNIREALTTP
jgi:chromosomal replication initiator protein